jgi:hypothetical protein
MPVILKTLLSYENCGQLDNGVQFGWRRWATGWSYVLTRLSTTKSASFLRLRMNLTMILAERTIRLFAESEPDDSSSD